MIITRRRHTPLGSVNYRFIFEKLPNEIMKNYEQNSKFTFELSRWTTTMRNIYYMTLYNLNGLHINSNIYKIKIYAIKTEFTLARLFKPSTCESIAPMSNTSIKINEMKRIFTFFDRKLHNISTNEDGNCIMISSNVDGRIYI